MSATCGRAVPTNLGMNLRRPCDRYFPASLSVRPPKKKECTLYIFYSIMYIYLSPFRRNILFEAFRMRINSRSKPHKAFWLQRTPCLGAAPKKGFLAVSVSQGDRPTRGSRWPAAAGRAAHTTHARRTGGAERQQASADALHYSTCYSLSLRARLLRSFYFEVVSRGGVGFPSGVVGRQTDTAKCLGSW